MFSICPDCWINKINKMGKNNINLTDRTIDVLQWILIIVLLSLIGIQAFNYNRLNEKLIANEEYNRENTYVRIYESRKLDKLKKENKELYDSINKLKNVESGMIIKFVEHYKTDTIKVDNFILKTDTIYYSDGTALIDSIYKYEKTNDTINCHINIKAKDLSWCNADFSIRDKFIIINREKDGTNQTSITHSDNTTIEGTTMWHRENNKKWYEKFTVGPQIGVGYGTFHKDIDLYLGIGISYNLGK